MELITLIDRAASFLNEASERSGSGFPDQAKARLIELCKLLEVAPELWGGDDTESPKEPKE